MYYRDHRTVSDCQIMSAAVELDLFVQLSERSPFCTRMSYELLKSHVALPIYCDGRSTQVQVVLQTRKSYMREIV